MKSPKLFLYLSLLIELGYALSSSGQLDDEQRRKLQLRLPIPSVQVVASEEAMARIESRNGKRGKGKRGKGMSKSEKSESNSSSSAGKKGSGGKKGMGGKKGGSQTPTVPPVGGPTMAPAVSSAPTPMGSMGPSGAPVPLTPFALSYTIDQSRLPPVSDTEAVASLTNTYVDQFFRTSFLSGMVRFQSADTVMTDSEFIFGAPYVVNYTTSLTFEEGSFVPPLADLDMLLQDLFVEVENNAEYLSLLEELPTSNIFQTTSRVDFEFTPLASSSSTSRSTKSNSLLVAISASAAAMLVFLGLAGVAAHRRKSKRGHAKASDQLGHKTVAGTCENSSACSSRQDTVLHICDDNSSSTDPEASASSNNEVDEMGSPHVSSNSS